MDAILTSPTFKVLGTLLTAYATWRIYRFTLFPVLHPNWPKELPYSVPVIGHAFPFFLDFNGAMRTGLHHFAPSREPFAMTVAGQTIYVATSAEDINTVWRTTGTISQKPIAMDMYVWGGISEKSRKKLFEVREGARWNEGMGRNLNPTAMGNELHRRQVHPGARLEALMGERILPSLSKGLDFNTPGHVAVKSRNGKSVTVSLLDLCVELFITSTTDAFFGPKLRQLEPNLIKAFESWEQCNWKFLFQLPDVFARDMLAAKETLTNVFAKYYASPKEGRQGAVYYVQALEEMLKEVGISEVEMGSYTMLQYWAINGNVYKLAFWLVAHLAWDPNLMKRIQEEVLPAMKGGALNEKYLLDQCPKLASLVEEILRLVVSSSLARVIMEPTVVGGKTLLPGNKIMLPIQGLHLDPEVWGHNPDTLQPYRFHENAKMGKNLSFRPWGGGHTLCPGQYLAKRSVKAFVAVLLSRYDLEVESTSFPVADGGKPSPGVVLVGKGQDMMLRCTPRA